MFITEVDISFSIYTNTSICAYVMLHAEAWSDYRPLSMF